MLTIDGSRGEGGGQILRSSLALSVVTGTPFRLEKIRARRKPPGLRPQHLACVAAAKAISNASVEGDSAGSSTLTFNPGPARHGDYRFAVGTAGSTTLVLQTVLPPLMMAPGTSTVEIEGGTHNPFAPPVEFLAESFLPVLRAMGADVSLELSRAGFYPKGGGSIKATIHGGHELSPLELLDRGDVDIQCRALLANLPAHIAGREHAVLCRRLHLDARDGKTVMLRKVAGAGNAVVVTVQGHSVTETITAIGSKGKPAEVVANEAADEALTYLSANVPVGPHLADQLLIPLALAGGGRFHTMMPTQHTRTNADILQLFLPFRILTGRVKGEAWEVSVQATS